MSSIFKLLLHPLKFIYLPANRSARHLVLPIDIAYLTVNVYRYYTELRPTVYIVPKFKHVVSSCPSHFVYSVMNTLSRNLRCTKASEVVSEIFTYVTL